MKIGMNVIERLVAVSLLPKEGSFATLRIIGDLKNKVGIKAEEYTTFDICDVLEDGTEIRVDKHGKRIATKDGIEVPIDGSKNKVGIKWNEQGNKEKEFDFMAKEMSLFAEQLRTLEKNVEYNKTLKEGKTPKPALEERHVSLYAKFVEEKEPETKENTEKK